MYEFKIIFITNLMNSINFIAVSVFNFKILVNC